MRFPKLHHGDEEEPDQADDAGAPFPGYDRMDEKELIAGLHRHSQAELDEIDAYERAHQSRIRVLNKLHYLHQREPLPGYDGLSAAEVIEALEEADLATLKRIRGYERRFADRPDVLDAVEVVRRKREGDEPPRGGYRATSYGPSVSTAGSRVPRPGQLGAHKDLVSRFYAEAINSRDLDAVERLLSEDFVHNGEPRHRKGQREAVAEYLEAFPDLHVDIELILAEGDLVAAHQRWSGTHDGVIAGVEPTGRRVEFTSTAILRIHDGLISEAWDEVDLAGLMAQLTQPSET